MKRKLNPRSKSDIIKDPIHGYIVFTLSDKDEDINENAEIDIIDNRWMQRLKRIFQLQTAWLVYPGATHTRFLHSLGVMHLAGKFARHLYFHFKEVFPNEYIPEMEYVVETCRLAGLLHDIGHGPFGHTLDQVHSYAKYKVTHEDIGKKIILTELSDTIKNIHRSPEGKFSEELNPEIICNFIKPEKKHSDLWEKLFSRIIFGLYSVDKLDYLIRDAYYCGVREYGLLDIDRLIKTTSVSEKGLTLHKSSSSALKSFLISRLFMYENVYYHKTVRSIDISFSELLGDVLEKIGLKNPLNDLELFYSLDDFRIHSLIPEWAKKEDKELKKLGIKWKKLINRNLDWKLAYQKDINTLTFNSLFFKIPDKKILAEKLKSRLESDIEIKIDVPILDVRPENPFSSLEQKSSVSIYDPILNKIDYNGLKNLTHNIPVKFLSFRVFAKEENITQVYECAKQIFDESEVELQESSF